ncbi:hypothetical protein [Coraliomargarita akajimensis]|nr:hypothetical protein [Coraliomargarita akajimensis]
MTKGFSLIFSVLIAFVSTAGAVGYMELSNPSGQTISAKPVSVFGEKVRIKLEDGREMNVALTMFAPESAAQLKQWAIEQLAKKDQLFDSEVKRREKVTNKFEKDIPLTNGGVAKGAMKVKEMDGYYDVSLTNRSDFDLSELRFEYRVFSAQDAQAKKDRHDVKYKRKAGVETFSMKKRGQIELTTTPIKLVETELGKGIVWAGGGDLKAEAEMVGVWCRVYYGETIVEEYCRPSMLKEREDW